MTDYEVKYENTTVAIPTQGSVPVTFISGWIMMMHRYVPSGFNWNQTWDDYRDGFGDIHTEDFWLGLERVHLLTTSGNYRLRLKWQANATNYWFSTEYWSFYIDDEAGLYQLHVSGHVDGDDGRALCV